MNELRRGDDPPREDGEYVIAFGNSLGVMRCDVVINEEGSPDILLPLSHRWISWMKHPITHYRKFDPVSYLEGATP